MMRRFRWLGLGLGLLASGAGEAFHRQGTPACAGGRYVVRDGQILFGPTMPLPADTIVFDTQVAIGSGCSPVPVHPRGTFRGTNFRARWRTCEHLFGGALLRARLDPSCETMTGVFVGRRAKFRRRFVATRSVCGDGIFDPGAEACEGGAGCAHGTCTSGCVCVDEVLPESSTTTTLSSPTTTVPITIINTTTTTPATGGVPTTSTTSTRVSTTSTSTGPLPVMFDLVPTFADAPAMLLVGQAFTLRWTVANRSTSAAGPSWLDVVLFSTDAALGDDTPLAATTWGLGLPAGSSYVTAQPVQIPAVAPGEYFLLIHVDHRNAKLESNEANNVLAVPVSIVAP